MRYGLVWLLYVGLLPACTDRDDHAHPQLKTGKQLYDHHCAACHRGEGEGSLLRGVPPVSYTDLTLRKMVDLIRGHTRAQGSRMPSFANMPTREAEAIAVYIHTRLRVK